MLGYLARFFYAAFTHLLEPMTPEIPRGNQSFIRRFISSEASGGLILMGAAVLALIVANSPLADTYFAVLASYVAGLSVLHWINDALMAVFFLMVGLEIKREVLTGQLSTWPQRVLPGIAALGGMIMPAAVYLVFNWSSAETTQGWAIPAATDIAFSLGVAALLGSRVPLSIKVFLTAVAIFDDLGAVAVIALFYTAELNGAALAAAAVLVGILAILNRAGVNRLPPYLIIGLGLWYAVLLSGVHATIAGVLVALTVPLAVAKRTGDSPLLRLEHGIHPWVAFLIVPIFGFANAGVSFAGFTPSTLLHPVTLGVALGLFVGKQLGVFGVTFGAIRLGLAALPTGASFRQLYGVALLCGIGFTMSLFIGLLAFPDSVPLQDAVKIGVIAGSALSAAVGAAVLALGPSDFARF
jgi:Na+:H+ antiporter, NhaA family